MCDESNATSTYGHIGMWNTTGITDMSFLFCVRQSWMDGNSDWDDCVLEDASFNEDISGWQTGAVTTFAKMFYKASDFNQLASARQ